MLAVRALRVARAPSADFVQFVPDDAYYYAETARHFARGLGWSFDGVSTTTTGIQPAYAYFLAIVAWLAPHLDGEGLLRVAVIASVPLLIVAAAMAADLVRRTFGPISSVSVPIVLGSGLSLSAATSGMEWPFLVLASVLVLRLVLTAPEDGMPNRGSACLPFLCGAFAVSSRIDAIVAVAILGFASAVLGRGATQTARRGLWAAAGGFAAFGFFAVQNRLLTGHWLQDSARVKLSWSTHYHYDPLAVASLFWDTSGLRVWSMSLLSARLLTNAIAGRSFRSAPKMAGNPRSSPTDPAPTSSNPTTAVLEAAAVVFAYMVVYGNATGFLQTWYSANAVGPELTLIAGLIRAATGSGKRMWRRAFGYCAATAAVVNLMVSVKAIDPPWPHQKYMREAGLALRDGETSGQRLGAWNSGIIGSYRGGAVINLDGLANGAAADFVEQGDLLGYLRSARIAYVIDFEAMLRDPLLRVRGGYTDPRFVRALIPVRRFESSERSWCDSALTLYRVELEGN